MAMKMTAREQRMAEAMKKRGGMEDTREDMVEDDAEMRGKLLEEAMKKRRKDGGRFGTRPPMMEK